MEDVELTTILTREDLKKRGWTARQIRKQRPDTLIKSLRPGRPKFGSSLASVLAVEAAIKEAKAIVAESRKKPVAETITPVTAVA